MPNADPSTTLHSVFTFYSDILTLTAEGDSVVRDETLEGLGRSSESLLKNLFGSFLRLFYPPPVRPQSTRLPPKPPTNSPGSSSVDGQAPGSLPDGTSPLSSEAAKMASVAGNSYVQAASDVVISTAGTSTVPQGIQPPVLHTTDDSEPAPGLRGKGKEIVLISYLPDPGYFIAGAVAGGISRTTTAPLDRLKVYLLVNTSARTNPAVEAAKKGQPLLAVRNAGRPLITAVAELYKSGGVRGFFAGTAFRIHDRTHIDTNRKQATD